LRIEKNQRKKSALEDFLALRLTYFMPETFPWNETQQQQQQ
jgi:hypothetical protein